MSTPNQSDIAYHSSIKGASPKKSSIKKTNKTVMKTETYEN